MWKVSSLISLCGLHYAQFSQNATHISTLVLRVPAALARVTTFAQINLRNHAVNEFCFNPFMGSGLSHPSKLDQFISKIRDV